MGLNEQEIPFCFLRMIQVSIEASFTFIRRHPLISGVWIILCILYLFLYYIYHFLVSLSPFLVCAAIFVRIFWSSEEGQLSFIKKQDKREEPKEIEKQLHKLPSYGKRDMLLDRRYSSRNATSRRRNFTDKKWDVQDAVVEAKVKESFTVESSGSEKEDATCGENEENSSNFAKKLQNTDVQISPLQSTGSINELIKASDSDQKNNRSDDCSDGLAFEKRKNSSDYAGKSQNTDAQISPVQSAASINELVNGSDSDQQNNKPYDCSSDGLALEKEKNSSDYVGKSQNTDAQVSPSESEPSVSDRVKIFGSDQQNNKSDRCSSKPAFEQEGTAGAKEQKGEEEEGEESQDEEESPEETNKAVGRSKDDQKSLMDLGTSEIERYRRLESLIARRRARQQMKQRIEQGLSPTDLRSSPSRMAPLNIARTDPLKSPRNYGGVDGLEIPGSAPSALRQLRNPFDLPYDASEDKPNLTGDSFQQEFIPKDMTFCRHESFSYGASLQFDEQSYPFFNNGRRISDRFRRLPDTGNHDLIIEKLFSKSIDTGSSISAGVKAPKPLLVKFETASTNHRETKTDNRFGLKWKKLVNAAQAQAQAQAQATQSFSDHTSEPSFMQNNKISNNDKFGVSEKPEEEESKTHHHKLINKKFLNFPIATTGTAIFEASLDSLSSPTIKNQEDEDMPFPDRFIFHEPTCSIASDLQVEFSEIGSPTALTVDGESVVFDGEFDNEAVRTPRSDDLGPISINLRSYDEISAGVSSNNSPQSSPIFLRQKVGGGDVIDVSSHSSTSDLHGDSPTHAKINYGYNIFSDMTKADVETQETHPSNFLIGRPVDHHPPHETRPQKPEKRQKNLSKNSETEAQVVDHHGVSSPPSTSDSHEDTPIHEKINYDHNVFSDMNRKDEEETEATQPSNSSEKSEERLNLSESSETEAQIMDHHVTDSSNTDIENSNSSEDLWPPVVQHQHRESIDAVSMNTFSPLSHRSLSPDKTLMNHVSSSAFNQHISTYVPQLNIEDLTQEPQTSELISNTMPPLMQPLSVDPVAITRTSVSSDFQEPTCSSTMPDDYNTTDKSGKLIFDDVDRKENDTLIISRNMDPADSHVNPVEEKISGRESDAGQEKFRNDCIKSLTSTQMKILDEINNESEVVGNDEVTSSPSVVTEMLTQLADVDPPKANKTNGNFEEVSDMHRESKKDNNEEEIKGELKDEILPKPSMLKDGSEGENDNVLSEPMKNDAETNETLKNYIPENLGETNNSSEEVNEAPSETKKNDPKISDKEEIKENLKNDNMTKLDKPNDSSEEVSKVQSEPKQNYPEMSNTVEISKLSNNDTSAKSDKQIVAHEK